MTNLPEWGAFGFGLVLGWFLYFVNRYRKSDVTLGDLTTVIGAVGGAAITALFGSAGADLFGAYGVGLATGFFSYFLVLVILVSASKNFDVDFFLDGRRKGVDGKMTIPDGTHHAAMNFDNN